MAEGDAKEASKWPGPVQADEGRKGFWSIFLTVDGLKPKTAMMSRKPAKEAKNGVVTPEFSEGRVRCTITKDGEEGRYEYEKNIPEEYDKGKCYIEVVKHGVYLHIAKSTAGSWAQHNKYFLSK